jgi:hypothetical protein
MASYWIIYERLTVGMMLISNKGTNWKYLHPVGIGTSLKIWISHRAFVGEIKCPLPTRCRGLLEKWSVSHRAIFEQVSATGHFITDMTIKWDWHRLCQPPHYYFIEELQKQPINYLLSSSFQRINYFTPRIVLLVYRQKMIKMSHQLLLSLSTNQ